MEETEKSVGNDSVHEKIKSQLYDYADLLSGVSDTPEDIDIESIKKHISECAECRAELEEILKLKAAIQKIYQVPDSLDKKLSDAVSKEKAPSRGFRRPAYFGTVAAVAIIVLFIGASAFAGHIKNEDANPGMPPSNQEKAGGRISDAYTGIIKDGTSKIDNSQDIPLPSESPCVKDSREQLAFTKSYSNEDEKTILLPEEGSFSENTVKTWIENYKLKNGIGKTNDIAVVAMTLDEVYDVLKAGLSDKASEGIILNDDTIVLSAGVFTTAKALLYQCGIENIYTFPSLDSTATYIFTLH
ncbi:hypothetical protein SDC9_76362 [bioreactor metagenome]|uniref:Zinc-finger domain-containing protein n=1 Tax=bioreactor metagenome TaxID=1076179 RepID=A0A644YPN1_9ZZZZ|nr:hypothetical protein [Oscillospiraceae bacterium]